MKIMIDRMELDDIGNPQKIAQFIINSNPDLQLPIPIEEIAHAAGITHIERKDNLKFEGALLSNDVKTEGIIVCNSSSAPERQRFTIAHELGHFLIPMHSNKFNCATSSISFTNNGSFINKEQEANAFASQILLPPSLLKKEIDRTKYMELEKLEQIRKKFAVSLEACVRSAINFLNEPTAFIFSYEGIIKSFVYTKDFPFLGVKPKEKMPVEINVDNDYEILNTVCRDGDFWLCDKPHLTVCEQHIITNKKRAITMLTLDED